MLFSEIYSTYYNTVAQIISSSQKGNLDSDSLFEIVKNSAFQESVMTIPSALESGKWPLIKKDYTTNIKKEPTMPLSFLQKRWLKSILCDKRICLFLNDETLNRLEKQLESIEPLFTENDFYLYDQYSDGDPYNDSVYVKNFRTILKAIHEKKSVNIEYSGRYERTKKILCLPQKIEYSQKDDKFRVLCKIKNHDATLNIARIIHCEIDDFANKANITTKQNESKNSSEQISESAFQENTKKSVTLEIYDERKALERIMLAFAHFEKSAVQISEEVYQLTLNYDIFDETELVIRVLSFGPMIKVLSPESFKTQIKERIEKQIELMNQK